MARVSPRKGAALLGVLTLTWGVGWPIMKIALEEVPPWTFRTFCLIVGGTLTLVLCKAKGEKISVPRDEIGPLAIVSFVNVTLWNLFSAYGITLMEAGRAAIVAYTMPLWACLLGRPLLKEKVGAGRWVALTSGLLGLAVLMEPEVDRLGKAPLGSLLMLCAAISWALGTVLIKRRDWETPMGVFAGFQLIVGGIPALVGMVLLEPPFWEVKASLLGWLATAYIVIVGVVLGYWGWLLVIEAFPVSIASLGTMAVPVIGVISGGILLGEPIGVREMISLVLVVGGVGGVLRGQTRSRGG